MTFKGKLFPIALLFVAGMGVYYPKLLPIIGLPADGDRLVAYAVFLTGAVIVYCMPEDKETK